MSPTSSVRPTHLIDTTRQIGRPRPIEKSIPPARPPCSSSGMPTTAFLAPACDARRSASSSINSTANTVEAGTSVHSSVSSWAPAVARALTTRIWRQHDQRRVWQLARAAPRLQRCLREKLSSFTTSRGSDFQRSRGAER